MAASPTTCAICGALITGKRGGELVKLPGKDQLVLAHPGCKGKPVSGTS